jgi:hypothetical protein
MQTSEAPRISDAHLDRLSAWRGRLIEKVDGNKTPGRKNCNPGLFGGYLPSGELT